jgi:hypothetical protein
LFYEERQPDMTKIIAAVHNFANVLENKYFTSPLYYEQDLHKFGLYYVRYSDQTNTDKQNC